MVQPDLKAVVRTPLKYCNFCGKNDREVRTMIAGPDVNICDECVSLCDDICREKCVGYHGEREARTPFLEVPPIGPIQGTV